MAYVKNELAYNGVTWTEWEKPTGSTYDSAGIKIVASGTYLNLKLVTSIKPSTKYGLIVNVLENSVNSGYGFCILRYNGWNTQSKTLPSLFTGTYSTTFTTGATILENKYFAFMDTFVASGQLVKLKDFRIFELPTGSQIETDFNTLTATQLEAKYPYEGYGMKTDWTATDYYNYADLNRVEKNITYLSNLVGVFATTPTIVGSVTNRTNTRIEFYDEMNRIEGNILAIKNVIGEPEGWITPKTDWVSVLDKFGYIQANRLETDLSLLKFMAERIKSALLNCGNFYCGEQTEL